MNTYLIADTHFNHENIIKYCNRPFKSVYEMNEYMIKKWNEVVKTEDVVYHLGDFGFGTNEGLKKILNRLNGTKILLRGNHDLKRGANKWLETGFSEVHKKQIVMDKYILTHEPIQVEDGYINIFGHIHNNELNDIFKWDNRVCISVELIDYTPITLDEINKLLEKQLNKEQ